jgi:type IV pilus assembly protein PilE
MLRDKPMMPNFGRRLAAGFTLVELMVVVIIVAILAAIAIPGYEHEVQESRRTEARTAILDLAAREQRYFATENTFTNSFGNLGYSTAGSSPASITVGSGYYQVVVNVPAVNPPDPNAGNLAPPSFSITATPVTGSSQASDSACTSFTIDSAGYQSAQSTTGDDTATCWGQ